MCLLKDLPVMWLLYGCLCDRSLTFDFSIMIHLKCILFTEIHGLITHLVISLFYDLNVLRFLNPCTNVHKLIHIVLLSKNMHPLLQQ